MRLEQVQDPTPGHCGDCHHWHKETGHDGHCEQPELTSFNLHVHDDDGCNRFEPEAAAAAG